MVLSIFSSLVFVFQKRRLVEIFPDHVRKVWNKWELRALVLVSLVLQISLIYSGNRRKYIVKRRVRIFIWFAYLMADWVATVALGVLVDRLGNSGTNEYGDLTLMAFWAPFMLLHLGGPDTITAYALADNELWLRHLLGLVVQTSAAIYITLLAWKGTLLSFLTIPMLLCGLIKYGERTWVLMSGTRDQFRDSNLTDNDPSPSYSNFMDEFCLKEAEGYYVTAVEVEEGNSPEYDIENTIIIPSILYNDKGRIIHIANYFFETLKFKRLFVDLILGFHEQDKSKHFFERQDHTTVFEVIEVELGFAYDVFYTKVPIIYTRLGLVFRLITSSITLTVMLILSISIDVKSDKHQGIDVVISYLLLIGAVLLEAYAIGSLLLSDWGNLRFTHIFSKIPLFGDRLVSSSLQAAQKGKRWSNSMYQYNLLGCCLNQHSTAFQNIPRFIPFKNFWRKLESFSQLEHIKVSPELKSFVLKRIKEISTNTEDFEMPFTRGASSLRKHQKFGMCKWTVDVEYDHSILIWHVATDLCYNLRKSEGHVNTYSNVVEKEYNDHMTFSKELADYMLYILVMCPFMLPMGIGMVRFRDTCSEASSFFKERSSTSKLKAYEMLGQVNTKVFASKVKGDRSKSVLFEACKLAASLNEMDNRAKMWKMVGDVWTEILFYAAIQCRGFDHAQQLEKGGELLTHVWLLMAHLGITERLQIKEGHGRVKLVVT